MADIRDQTKTGRIEDGRFLTGDGRYTDDLPGRDLAVVFLRSPHAHAVITGIDAAAASLAPGVVAVLTGADVAKDGIRPIPPVAVVNNRDGRPMAVPPRPVMATDRVRHVGEIVAMVIAETVAAARDGAEAIIVNYDPLPAVLDCGRATAPSIWPGIPDNLCFDWATGDAKAVEAAFQASHRVVRLRTTLNRQAGLPMENRGAIARHDRAADRVTLTTPSQGAHLLRRWIGEQVLSWPAGRLRVVTPDVGGGFGVRFATYPEQALLAWAARRLARDLRWSGERSEAFVSDTQSRDQIMQGALALDEAGRFLALEVEIDANLGAAAAGFAAGCVTDSAAKVISGLYRIPAIHMRSAGRFTNTVPVDAYRGAGKPEALFLLERLVDLAAEAAGLDPIEIRRRNLVPSAAMPYRTALGKTYDGGDFAATLDRLVAGADLAGFARRREDSGAAGRLRGLGISCFLHGVGGVADETARVEVLPEGKVIAETGTQSTGQGHETAFARVVADALGVPRDSVALRQGDSDRLPRGGGTGGSSSAILSANTLRRATLAVIERGRRIAAQALEAAPADIEFSAGVYRIAGTDRSLGLFDVAALALTKELPAAVAGPLAETRDFADTIATFPHGAMAIEVEIDRETGQVGIARVTAAIDVGPRLDSSIVEGQIHGAIVQGIGQAVMEHCLYDRDTGQLLTGSLMDYAIPRADDLPMIAEAGVPASAAPGNAMGLRGVGEIGTNGAPAAVVNAVVDALHPLGVRHVDMPATAETIWRALGGGR